MSAACRRRRCTPRLRKRRISCLPLLHAHQSCYHANPVDWVSCTVPLLAIAPCPFARPPPSLPDASAPRAEPTLTPPHAEEARPPAATRSSFQFCTTSVSFVAPLATSGDAATMCAARDHWRAATKLRSTSCCMLPTPATNVAASVCPASRHDRYSSSNTSSTSSCSSLHTHTHTHRCYAQATRSHASPVSGAAHLLAARKSATQCRARGRFSTARGFQATSCSDKAASTLSQARGVEIPSRVANRSAAAMTSAPLWTNERIKLHTTSS